MITSSEIYHDRIKAGLTPEQIRERFEEMIEHLKLALAERKDEKPFDASPREMVRVNLGYILGYFGKEVREAWYGALPDVSHPVFGAGFGRGDDPTPKEAFEAGKRMGEKSKREFGISPEEAAMEAACDCTVGSDENHVCAVHGRLGG